MTKEKLASLGKEKILKDLWICKQVVMRRYLNFIKMF